MKPETKTLIRSLIAEEFEKSDKRDELIEQRTKIEKQLSLLKENCDEDGGFDESDKDSEIAEVKVGDDGEAEFEVKGTHLVEDNMEEAWTELEEEFNKLALEWEGSPEEEAVIVPEPTHLGEVPPSAMNESKIVKDLKTKMSDVDAKEIEKSMEVEKTLNESRKRARLLAGIDKQID